MDIATARARARAALHNLEAHRQRIDDLNVYPVPDGDTGTNLVRTVQSIVEALEASSAEGAESVAKELSRAALMGARGNSGVILSQIVRGFADVLGRSDEVDGEVLAQAFRSASDAAYRAIQRPVEGTMLTVIREMAEEAEQPNIRRLSKQDVLRHVVERGEESVRRTPELLAVLAEAGVVDAGGTGLLELVRGVYLSAAGLPLPEAAVVAEGLTLDAVDHGESQFRFCTNFVVVGEELD
ncbi:MAG: DAK2 domain-containing protein, partial [Gaiella sp.]